MTSMERQRRSDEAAANETRSEPFPEGTSIARYKIVSLIGSGAMGDVYRAHDRALNRDIALKVLPPDLTGDRERVRRFAHEARAASALSHPHIVGIHEVGHAKPVIGVHPIDQKPARRPEVHYISMELVEGETLREAFQSSMTLRRSVELLAQVADGLGKAHAAGIIHRDLKPDNILVSRDGYAKIVDFGLAKLTDTSWNPIGADSPTLRALTAHGELLGTPAYMAPEQIVGKPLDGRADIFAFGCILYEAVSHARPFEAESFVDTLYKIIHEDPAPLAQVAPNTPPELQRIVERCLAKDREARYPSIRDVAADLRQWHGESGARSAPMLAAGPLRPRINPRIALMVALIAAVPILAFILLGRPQETGATRAAKEVDVRRITNEGSATQAVISPDNRYVAYITADANGRTMWLEQIATGRTIAIVPAKEAIYAGISFSRDGEYIYFSRYDGGPLGTLYRVPILGGAAEALVKDIDSRATLSPDNKELAFMRDDFNKGTSTLMVANADGTNEHALAQFKMPDRALQPAWSPDGSRIVAIQQAKLVSVDVKTGAVRTIATDVDFEGFRGLAWRDDNHLVTAATSDEAGSHFRLWSIEIRSGKATALTSDLTELWGPTVSESGTVAAMQVVRQSNLFEISTASGVKQLTSSSIGSATGSSGVAWLGDRVIYASLADGRMDLFSRRGNEITRLTDDSAYELRPVPSADGSFIAYLSSAGGTHTLWRVAPDGANRTKLTNGPRDSAFALSPDSKSVAFASLDTKSNEWVLWVMPSNGGPRRRITARTAILEDIRFTPDGKTLFFTGYEKDMMRVYRVPFAGGAVEEVFEGRARQAEVSPDGSTVLAPYGEVDKLHAPVAMAPVRGGAMKTIDLGAAMYRWHPKGNALSYVREENGAMNLWLRPLDSDKAKQLTWFSEGIIVDYAWRKDGTQAVVTHVVDSTDVVLIK